MTARSETLASRLTARFGERLRPLPAVSGDVAVRVAPEELVAVCRVLRDDAEFGFEQLIDLSGVDYISSAGLRVLLVLAKKVQQQKGKVALGGLVANVREVFAVSGFDSIFAIEPDTDAAIAAVR